jgi:hypothetical protein
MASKKKGGSFYERPDGSARQSQLLTTYGAGAMIDLVERAVLVRGIDYWRYDPAHAYEIPEPRLQAALSERFRAIGRELERERPFRAPPAGNDSDPRRNVGVQTLTFPWWYVCSESKCRTLCEAPNALPLRNGRYVHNCTPKGTAMVPVRFVGACRKGHLQEFPWKWFVHRNQSEACSFAQLTLREGPTGDFSEIRVGCKTCGAEESLVSAQAEHARPPCSGRQPWLGPQVRDPDCGEKLRLLVRTASNAYFSQTESALSLPVGDKGLDTAVASVASRLKRVDSIDVLRQQRANNEDVEHALTGYADADVLAALLRLRAGDGPEVEPIRVAEYRVFLAQPEEQAGEKPQQRDGELFARRIARPDGLPAQVERIVLARKLREVMVQLGFTRIEFPTVGLSGEFDLQVEQARIGHNEHWLPAAEIRGEGIFLALDEAHVERWLARPAVQARERELASGYEAWTKTLQREAPPFPGARYYMLHSLSHMLMTAISLDCGYPASSIRERLYCSEPDDALPRAAILLATGSTGAEGTLGGLVDQGKALVHHLRRAHDDAQLCSSDPVCAHHSPERDPAERFLEGAACHGCLFVAECSCERFNRYLDRALVVPTLGKDPALAFFPGRP